MRVRHDDLFALLALVGGTALSCSAIDSSTLIADDTTITTGTGGAPSGGGGGGEGGGFDPGQSDGGLQDGEICEELSADAEDIALELIVLLDRSGSMNSPFGNTKWTNSINALKSFFTDPESSGITVGINFFPHDSVNTCSPTHAACDPTLYGKPAAGEDIGALHVPLTQLPAGAPSLNAAMDADSPDGFCTPMHGALHGTLAFATARQEAFPERKVVVVFASDGEPNGCPTEQNQVGSIGNLVASAYNFNSLQTYVIAIDGSTVADLNELAAKGGTGAAFNVTQDIGAFADKMNEIRQKALGCEYLIPGASGELNPEQVNVSYTPGDQDVAQTLKQAANLGDCGGLPGWYYDDPDEPTKIFLCPTSCATVGSDPDGRIRFAFGCPTEVN